MDSDRSPHWSHQVMQNLFRQLTDALTQFNSSNDGRMVTSVGKLPEVIWIPEPTLLRWTRTGKRSLRRNSWGLYCSCWFANQTNLWINADTPRQEIADVSAAVGCCFQTRRNHRRKHRGECTNIPLYGATVISLKIYGSTEDKQTFLPWTR